MKSFVAWVIGIGVVAGGGAYGFTVHSETKARAAYDSKLAEIKQDFLTKSVGLRQLEPDQYRREVGIALTHYFRELKDLASEYPQFYDVEREKVLGELRVAEGSITTEHKAQRDERIDITLELFNKMRSGSYRPLYTAADKTFRFDIYDMTTEKIEGSPRIKMAYVHWGAFGPVSYNSIEGNFQAEQVKGQPLQIPRLEGAGQPPSLQINPERWINEMVPGLEIGYYDFPLFPPEANSIQLNFEMAVRTIGGTSIPVTLQFDPIPIQPQWKSGEGEKWANQEQFLPEEELKKLAAGHKAETE